MAFGFANTENFQKMKMKGTRFIKRTTHVPVNDEV